MIKSPATDFYKRLEVVLCPSPVFLKIINSFKSELNRCENEVHLVCNSSTYSRSCESTPVIDTVIIEDSKCLPFLPKSFNTHTISAMSRTSSIIDSSLPRLVEPPAAMSQADGIAVYPLHMQVSLSPSSSKFTMFNSTNIHLALHLIIVYTQLLT